MAEPDAIDAGVRLMPPTIVGSDEAAKVRLELWHGVWDVDWPELNWLIRVPIADGPGPDERGCYCERGTVDVPWHDEECPWRPARTWPYTPRPHSTHKGNRA